MAFVGRLAAIAWLALAVAVAPARADPPAGAGSDVPWARGVTPEQRAAAQSLLDQGNDLLLHDHYREALAKYQAAIAIWDHPAIRFNMVRALIALDRSVEAADNLDKALAYGAAPLDDAVYREALNYQRLLAGQLATVEVTCTQAGVHVTFDGNPLLACPGAASLRTTPGAHAIVGTKDGFLTKTFDAPLLPGKRRSIEIALVARGAATVTHRWALWKPSVVTAGGVALLGAGALLEILAHDNVNRYDARVASCQAAQTDYANGCPASDPRLERYHARSRLEQGLGISAFAAGGAALVTGIVLLALDHSRAYVAGEAPPIALTILNGGAGAVWSGRF